MKGFRRLQKWAVACCATAILSIAGCSSPSAPSTSHGQHAGKAIVDTAKKSGKAANASASVKTKAIHKPHKKSVPKPPMLTIGTQSSYAQYLNESLSLLGYLPVSFTPSQSVDTSQAMAQLATKIRPISGSYQWKDKNTAAALASLWNKQTDNVITQGALMHFQLDHNLTIDGIAGPQVWKALQQALKTQSVSHAPYTFVTVDEHPTEVLKVWQNGQVVLQTPANTGVADAPTSIGTWPVYLRYQSQEMKGTTPSGETYDDPGVPYVSYFHNGEAVHGFVRSSYGSPQSLGCVEIPVNTAKTVYQLINYGTLVSVRSN